MHKKGVNQLIAAILLVVFVITISIILFKFISRSATLETTKSIDKANAQEICMDRVKIRVNNAKLATIISDSMEKNVFEIHVENLKGQEISDFVVRLEEQGRVDLSKVKQILGGYEKGILQIDNIPKTDNFVVKVIPQITLKKPDIKSGAEGWWLCSKQMAVYKRG